MQKEKIRLEKQRKLNFFHLANWHHFEVSHNDRVLRLCASDLDSLRVEAEDGLWWAEIKVRSSGYGSFLMLGSLRISVINMAIRYYI